MWSFGIVSFSRANQLLMVRNGFCKYCRLKSYRVKKDRRPAGRFRLGTSWALEHFDFYYKPIYRNLYPSIRLALLSDQKYGSVVNNFHGNADAIYEDLVEKGAFDVIKMMNSAAENEVKETVSVAPEIVEDEDERVLNEPLTIGLDEKYLRTEAGLSEFVPPTPYSIKDVQHVIPSSEKYWASPSNLQLDSVADDKFIYPDRLRLLSFPRGDINNFQPSTTDFEGTQGSYHLDSSSLLPVLALGLKRGDKVLDLCAAPGGKSLLIFQTLLPESLTCNDGSLSRLTRLRRMLLSYVPESGGLRDRIILTNKDGSDDDTWEELDTYDKVLVDAPCTTDKQALFDETDNMFKKSRIKDRQFLPELQARLLVNGIRSAKPGGIVVYSTCTLSPLQNEDVVLKAAAIAKNYYKIDVIQKELKTLISDASSTDLFRFFGPCNLGALVLPFLPSNFGPMYVCKLQRIN